MQDNGIGIPHAALEQIFDMFQRMPTQETRPTDGLGVGLSLVRTLVELHGGSVRAFSEGPGKGSRFTVADLLRQCICITLPAAVMPPSDFPRMASLEIESTLTDRYQTTVPDAVRRTLKLRKRDKIRYVVRPDGAVLLTRADAAEESDPVVGKFLAFLARDMAAHPAQIRSVDPALVRRARSLVKGIKIDLEAPLPAEEE